MAQVPNALIVNPDNIKASSVPELIEYLKGNSDRTICATQGNGTTSHLTSELFQLMAKVKLRHIPYRGSAPALQGLVAGDVDVMFDNLGVSLALVQAGKLKLLAVASSDRLPALPNVPTMAETLPGFEAVAWYGIVAPPKTPKDIVDKINADVNEALRQPELQEQLKKLSAGIFGGPVDKTSRLHARGSRPVGRGDQVGQYRAAVGSRPQRPICVSRGLQSVRRLLRDQAIAIAAPVPACRFHATLR